MPYNTEEKRLAYLARIKKPKPVRICCVCNLEFTYRQGRTKGEACDSCYQKYRNLYNLMHSAKQRAEKLNIDFDLDINWLISQPEVCPHTGVKLSFSGNGSDYSSRSPYAASIDKVNPTKGYTKDNCKLVCWWFNCAKQRYTEEEVINLCKLVADTYTTKRVQDVEKEVATPGETM